MILGPRRPAVQDPKDGPVPYSLKMMLALEPFCLSFPATHHLPSTPPWKVRFSSPPPFARLTFPLPISRPSSISPQFSQTDSKHGQRLSQRTLSMDLAPSSASTAPTAASSAALHLPLPSEALPPIFRSLVPRFPFPEQKKRLTAPCHSPSSCYRPCSTSSTCAGTMAPVLRGSGRMQDYREFSRGVTSSVGGGGGMRQRYWLSSLTARGSQ